VGVQVELEVGVDVGVYVGGVVCVAVFVGVLVGVFVDGVRFIGAVVSGGVKNWRTRQRNKRIKIAETINLNLSKFCQCL